jgi:ABC-type uncharacterized transport system ATPase subunit
LNKKGKLTCWDMVTGKPLPNNGAKLYTELKDYEIYTWKEEDIKDQVYFKEWYSRILLKKKT